MVENADDDLVETKPILSTIPESLHRLRLKTNQILMELPFVLKFHLLTPVSPHLMSMKLTRIKYFQAKLYG